MSFLTNQPLKTAFLWNWAWVENRVVSRYLDGQLHLIMDFFPMMFEFNGLLYFGLTVRRTVSTVTFVCLVFSRVNL